nr:hypothetical protein [Totiviridae sp.]
MMCTQPIIQAPAADVELIMQYITWPAMNKFLLIKAGFALPAPLARVPTADEWYRIAFKIATLLGEEEMYEAALYTLAGMSHQRLHKFYDYGVAAWTPVSADCSAMYKEMSMPAFRCELSRLGNPGRPSQFTQTTDCLIIIESDRDTRLLNFGVAGAMIHAGYATAFKEFNITSEVLDVAVCRFLGMNVNTLPLMPGDALNWVNPLQMPWTHNGTGANGQNVFQQMAGVATLRMFGVTAPRYYDYNKRWMAEGFGRDVAFPAIPVVPILPRCTFIPLFTQLTQASGFCFYSHYNSISVYNMIRQGFIPRNWGLLGDHIDLNLTQEYSTSMNVRKHGLRLEQGIAWEAGFHRRILTASLFHSYGTRAINGVSLYFAQPLFNISMLTTDVGTNAEVDWQLDGIAPHPNIVPNRYVNSTQLNVNMYPTFMLFRMMATTYAINWQPPGNIALQSVLRTARAAPMTTANMGFRILRDKPPDDGDAPAPPSQIGEGWDRFRKPARPAPVREPG